MGATGEGKQVAAGEKTQPEGTTHGFPLPVALDTLPRLSPFPPGVGQQADHRASSGNVEGSGTGESRTTS